MYFYSDTGIHAVVESAKVSVSPFDFSSGIRPRPFGHYFCHLTVSHSVTLHLCSLFSQETRINCIRIARKGELFNANVTGLVLCRSNMQFCVKMFFKRQSEVN